jgi:uncharacterized protein
MKFRLVVGCWLFLFSVSVRAQNTPAPASTPSVSQKQDTSSKTSAVAGAKIDPAKEADIRLLLDVVGTKTLVAQTMEAMEKSMKPMLTNALPPGEYRERVVDLFFAKFHAKADGQALLELAIPLYDKNLSHQEVKGLIQFYQSPLGRKAVLVMPKLTAELQEEGRKWGENLGRQSMIEVMTEHPDLAQAMEDAQKAAHP